MQQDREFCHAGEYENLDCLRCLSLPGYIEARLSDHKPVCVEVRRTDTSAHAALPERPMPIGEGREGAAPAGSLLHGAGNVQGTSPVGGDDGQEWWQL